MSVKILFWKPKFVVGKQLAWKASTKTHLDLPLLACLLRQPAGMPFAPAVLNCGGSSKLLTAASGTPNSRVFHTP